MTEPQNMERRGGISFDFSVNIPTLIVLVTTLVSVTAGWVHQSDKATQLQNDLDLQTAVVNKASTHIERISTALTVLDERLKAYPLHRHISPSIVIYDNTPPGQIPAELEANEKRREQ